MSRRSRVGISRGARMAGIAATASLAPVVAGAVGITYSAVAIDHAVPVPPALDAKRKTLISSSAGKLSYYCNEIETGRPLLLVHSINAAASAYEMRPLFEFYRYQRPVYAVDLPGFGFSERSNRRYTPALYTAALTDLLEEVAPPAGGADVVALSLGGEFAARAALDQPELVHSLTLISPTGFTDSARRNRSERAAGQHSGQRLHSLFSVPLWSQALYDLIASRPSIRYFLGLSFVGQPPADLVEYDYATAHQPGARFAPLYFISGQLFTPDVRERVYERLTLPVLALYDADGFVRFDALAPMVHRHPNWRATRIAPSKGLPQFEQLARTTEALDGFWREIMSTAPSTADGQHAHHTR